MGSDPEIDQAIQYYPHLQAFIQQGRGESANYQQSLDDLLSLMHPQEVR
jgi:flagellar biosynthesis/type III secretory pathway ATPase